VAKRSPIASDIWTHLSVVIRSPQWIASHVAAGAVVASAERHLAYLSALEHSPNTVRGRVRYP
jgi:hypothetical protein